MAVITADDIVPLQTTTNTTPPKPKFAPDRYYRILKSILEGYGKSNYYQFKITQDPRPIQSLITRLSRLNHGVVASELKRMARNGLMMCCVNERKSVFKKGKKKKKPIRTYECTAEGLQFIEDYDGNKISWDWGTCLKNKKNA